MTDTEFELTYYVEPHVRRFCGPIFFTTSMDEAEGNVKANGSFGLVDTGERKLLVTCHHVWTDFQKMRAEQPELKMGLCLDKNHPIIFTPENPVAENAELDVVTFGMEDYLSGCDGRDFCRRPSRYSKILPRDRVFLIGFPGSLRRIEGGTIVFGRQPYGMPALSEDEGRFQLDVSRLDIQPDQYGGISGAPCFLVGAGRPIELAGIVTEVCMGMLWCAHARCLNSDGSITKKDPAWSSLNIAQTRSI